MLGSKTFSLAVFFGGIAVAACSSATAAPDTLFDKPLTIVRHALARDPDNPQAKAELSCFYYPDFVVKQIDLGEVDAQQLSIIPKASRNPAGEPVCSRSNLGNEKVVAADDWTGYFKGVKGGYVLFDAGDGWNGGLGFAVFTADARKVFDDAAKTWHAIALTPAGMSLRYTRVYAAKCSLLAGGAACWKQIRQDTALTGVSPPDCAAAYEREQKRVPKFAKQTLGDPTVIDYEALVTIGAQGHKIVPVTGKAIACRPAD